MHVKNRRSDDDSVKCGGEDSNKVRQLLLDAVCLEGEEMAKDGSIYVIRVEASAEEDMTSNTPSRLGDNKHTITA